VCVCVCSWLIESAGCVSMNRINRIVGGKVQGHQVSGDREPPLPTKWNGWGFKDTEFSLNDDGAVSLNGKRYLFSGKTLPSLRPWLEEKAGLDVNDASPAQNTVDVDASIRNEAFLAAVQGKYKYISYSDEQRLFHSHGHTSQEIWMLRYGKVPRVVDVVMWPRSHEDVEVCMCMCMCMCMYINLYVYVVVASQKISHTLYILLILQSHTHTHCTKYNIAPHSHTHSPTHTHTHTLTHTHTHIHCTDPPQVLVAAAVEHDVVIIPYGGGTSVSQALLCPENENRMIVRCACVCVCVCDVYVCVCVCCVCVCVLCMCPEKENRIIVRCIFMYE
jgi:hypothetical protein